MNTQLARRLGFGALIIYGIGDLLGAGIYTAIGKVVQQSGTSTWLTYILAAVLAAITGLSYAEMTARFPVSAGAAAFVRRAIPGKFVATVTGIMVLGTGLVSASVVVNGFIGYITPFTDIPIPILKLLMLSAISFLSFWGIQESSRANMVLTFVEMSGLLIVIFVGFFFFSPNAVEQFLDRAQNDFAFSGVVSGITIAFYAYIGFEDLVNLAEECKNPQRDLPRAILIAILVSTVLYILATLVLLLNVPIDKIMQSTNGNNKTQALLLVFEEANIFWFTRYFSIIAILAITNTGLINLIMASRLMYGMSQEALLPRFLAKVHPKRQTPYLAVITAFIAVAILVFSGTLGVLIKTTNLLIIMVFSMVHISLIIVRVRGHQHTGIRFPLFVPIIGLMLSLAILTQFSIEIWLRSSIILGLGIVIWGIQRYRTSEQEEKNAPLE